MDEIKTFSLLRHSRIFSVPDSNRDYLFIQAVDHPYLEEPYRAESYAIAWLKAGSIHMQAGLTTYDIQAPAVITVGPGVIRSFRKRNDLMEMDILFFKDDFLSEKHPDPFYLMKFQFFENNDLHVLSPTDVFLLKIQRLFELISVTQSDIIRYYIFALLYEINEHQPAVIPTPQHPVFTQFRKLLSLHCMAEHRLDFYAQQLHMTPKYLSALVKKHTGKSAGEWIDQTVVLEAKVLLQNKTLTVSQISDTLNFSDQSVFGKFFRANAGMSPIAYRKLF